MIHKKAAFATSKQQHKHVYSVHILQLVVTNDTVLPHC